jgi:hypothetical protein
MLWQEKFDAATVIDAINKITENTVLQPVQGILNRFSLDGDVD